MGALDAIEWQACMLEPVRNREAERYLRRTTGMVSPLARYFLDSPWVVHALGQLDVGCVPLRHVDPSLASMIALVVSQDNSCRFCYAATRGVLQILGFPEARIRGLEDGFLGAEFTPLQRAALDLARSISRAAPLCSRDAARPLLDAGGTPGLAQEVAYLAACNVFFNRISTLAALPPADTEGLASRWWIRLLRPLIASRVRNPVATAPTPLQPAQRLGLYADFVNALDGLPAAPRLRAVLDDAWDAPLLPRRLKALVFAVVGRGLGCALSEAEASQALQGEG
ncbi:MAG: carboxymuconolactone decarboxylase family protein, partial [Candidatus Binatia bacterium]